MQDPLLCVAGYRGITLINLWNTTVTRILSIFACVFVHLGKGGNTCFYTKLTDMTFSS